MATRWWRQDHARYLSHRRHDGGGIACRRLGQPSFQGFALSLTLSDEAKAHRFFGALSDGGQVHMPLAKTIFLPRFGIVADRFGVSCMVLVEP